MATGPDPRQAAVDAALDELARHAARVVEAPREAWLPFVERADVLGDLARALQALQVVAVERDVMEVMLGEAPIGIAIVGSDGRYQSANRALAAMYGHPSPAGMIGRPALDDIDPTLAGHGRRGLAQASERVRERLEVVHEHVAGDGRVAWHEAVVAPVRGPSGRPGSMALLVRDVTEHVLEERRAAQVQLALLPGTTPDIAGYELSSAYRLARNLSCDFFDWVPRPGGRLDLTIADIMGKGMGAALMMAALRTGLRAVRVEAGPAERVRTAVDSMALHGVEGGLPVTLFQARLDLATGSFRYVDAGHGRWAIRRASGRLDRSAAATTPPLLALPDPDVEEREVELEPGDALVLYTDGLARSEAGPARLDRLERDLDGARSAEEIVRRMLDRASPSLADDDVVVVALWRSPAAAAA